MASVCVYPHAYEPHCTHVSFNARSLLECLMSSLKTNTRTHILRLFEHPRTYAAKHIHTHKRFILLNHKIITNTMILFLFFHRYKKCIISVKTTWQQMMSWYLMRLTLCTYGKVSTRIHAKCDKLSRPRWSMFGVLLRSKNAAKKCACLLRAKTKNLLVRCVCVRVCVCVCACMLACAETAGSVCICMLACTCIGIHVGYPLLASFFTSF